MKFFEDLVPIPEKFRSFETGEPFKQCSLCGTNLLEPGTHYLIEKAFKKTEVIFEYALCWDCRGKVMNELSKASVRKITTYFEHEVDPEKRLESLLNSNQPSAEDWISHCLVKGTPVAELEEHQICGHFVDEKLALSSFPYAVGNKAIEELTNLLSSETLGILNDYSDRLFGIDMPNRLLIL